MKQFDVSLVSNKLIHDPDECLVIGAFVRAGRNALGLSQTALAHMLGVHRTTILRLEKGAAPLKRGLCETAIEVLGKAGVINAAPQQRDTQGRAGGARDIQMTVAFDSLRRAQRLIESGEAESDFGRLLLGEDFVPPLEEKPLRKK